MPGVCKCPFLQRGQKTIPRDSRRSEKEGRRFHRDKIGEKDLYHTVLRILEGKRRCKYFNQGTEDKKVIFCVEQKGFKDDLYLAARFLLKSNLKEEDMSTPEVVGYLAVIDPEPINSILPPNA